MKELRRRWEFYIRKWRFRIIRVKIYMYQRLCDHSFRPARIENKPGKMCRYCDKLLTLTPEEYYAEFGEVGWQQWK